MHKGGATARQRTNAVVGNGMQCCRRIVQGNLIGHAPHKPAALCAGTAPSTSAPPPKSMPSLERKMLPALPDACLPQQPCLTCQKHSYLTFKSVCKHNYPRWWAKWVCTSAANPGYKGLGQRHATQYKEECFWRLYSHGQPAVHPVKVTLFSSDQICPSKLFAGPAKPSRSNPTRSQQ